MPYIIHIPPYYQTRSYTFPPSYTTTAFSISISTKSTLAQAIYKDTESWGWHVETQTPDKRDWKHYTHLAKKRGWFNDLYKIWQREHGIRIREKDAALHRSVVPISNRMRHLREFGDWIRKRALRRNKRIDWERNARACEIRELLRRTVSETDVSRSAEVRRSRDTRSSISIPGSLVERLGGLRLDRRTGASVVDVSTKAEGSVISKGEDGNMKPRRDRTTSNLTPRGTYLFPGGW